MKFKYKNYGSGFLRPVIPIEIIYKNLPVPYEVLIDSGADFCIFDGEIGEYLGLEVNKGALLMFGGIQGMSNSKAYMHEVVLDIGGLSYKTMVGFSYDISKDGLGILGQKGFFDIFTVKFDYPSEDVEIKEKKKK